MLISRSLLLAFITTTTLAVWSLADDDAETASTDDAAVTAEGLAFFEDQIQPILEQNCYDCHGGDEHKGGLSLAGRDGLLTGGDSGPAIDLDDPDASLLLEAVNYLSYEMPPEGKLPQEQIDLLTDWVRLGAPMPEGGAVASHEPQVNEETKNHWSFRPIERPEVPEVQNADWVENEIDAFILAGLESRGLTPNPEADRRQLVRRLYYDLLGLPPTPEQVEEFVNDNSPDAWPRLIDRLLESPHYGEHWARYWLDLVRYAESNSYERDNPKPFVWRYRDYVIESFNNDKPYDQFVMEQLAGDEVDTVTRDSIIATGYYRLGLWDDEPADPELAYFDGLDDIVATTSQAFLGITMNCARCHAHKIDPVPQEDYYSFLAFFRNIRHYGVRGDDTVQAASVRPIATPEEAAAFEEELALYRAAVDEVRTQLEEMENRFRPHLQGGEIDDFQDQGVREEILRRHIGEFISQEEFDEYARLRRQARRMRDNPPQSGAQALCVKEHDDTAPETFVLIRGNPTSPGAVVEPAFPSVLSPPEPKIEVPSGGESCGRRRALAEWIVSPENPLAARVMANRIWQWHFGRGIVRSTNDFGLMGDRPTHPELLDWLAVEFRERGWSIKEMHRLILNSNTYRMSSAGNDAAYSVDPLNDSFWRFDMRRLRAEEVRDSILAVNGTLNLQTMFGPSVYPVIPDEVLAGQSIPGHNWGDSSVEDRSRRSIYIHIKRSLQVPLLSAFDVADADFTCPVRFATTQPTQALEMLNSDFLLEQAELLRNHLVEAVGDDSAAVVAEALLRVTQHPPTEEDVAHGIDLIASLEAEHDLSHADALKYFCLLALNLNEFLYLD